MNTTTHARVLLPDGRLIKGLHIIEEGIERFAYPVPVRAGETAINVRVLHPHEWVSVTPTSGDADSENDR